MVKAKAVLCLVAFSILPSMVSAQENTPVLTGTAEGFIGKVQTKIGDWGKMFNGLYPTSFLGRWKSREGKMYNLQTYAIKDGMNPKVLVLAEVEWNNPSDHGYGYHNIAFVDAADVKYSGEQKIKMDIGSCIPELGEAHLWSPRYSIVTMMRDIDNQHPKNAHEKYLADNGFHEGFAEEGWFVDADHGKLIPLTKNELSLLICRDRYDTGE